MKVISSSTGSVIDGLLLKSFLQVKKKSVIKKSQEYNEFKLECKEKIV
jgi:hypothetical protein